MTPRGWFNLLPDLTAFPSTFDPSATLTTDQAEQLDAISRSADCYSDSVCYGIAAIGELLAHAAGSGELSQRSLTDIGWLLHNLADLAAKLPHVGEGARDKLTTIPQER